MDNLETAAPTQEEKTLGMLSHLLAIFFGFLAPLIIWIVKKDESTYVAEQAKEALNFQITVFIGFVGCFILSFVLIGMLLMPVLAIYNVVMLIIGTIKANEGKSYRYPFTLRLIS
ncbi:MAG: DUF4870 domain-containing protein [Gammaproteobacteria bacterium]|nr:DUF4870 domain-containing protein [Gammaproteobacteria bacterium]